MWYKTKDYHNNNIYYLEKIGENDAFLYRLHSDDKGEKFLVGDFSNTVGIVGEELILAEYEKAPFPIRELWHNIKFGKDKYLWDEGMDCVYRYCGYDYIENYHILKQAFRFKSLDSIEMILQKKHAKILNTLYECPYVPCKKIED